MELNELKLRKDAIGYEYDEIAELADVDESVVREMFEGNLAMVPRELRLKVESVLNVWPKNDGGMGMAYSYPVYPSSPVKSSESKVVKPAKEKETAKKSTSKQKPSMKLEELKCRKYELGYTNEMIAEKSGVPLSTVQKIFAGFTLNPRYETRQAIEAVLNEYPDKLMETAATYNAELGPIKKQGEYTLEDYYDMPEERRVELIDGVIYDMTAPHQVHQRITTAIWGTLEAYIRKRNGKCVAFTSPADVRLMKDDKTMVQPDVFVVCDRNKLTGYTVEGAPDLIIEILSPSTIRKDMLVKLSKYV